MREAVRKVYSFIKTALQVWLQELSALYPYNASHPILPRLEFYQVSNVFTVRRMTLAGAGKIAKDIGSLFMPTNPDRWRVSLWSVWLFPDPQLILKRSVLVPRLATQNLNEIVALEFESWTSFSLQEVYAGWRTIRVDDKTAELEICFVPRPAVEGFIDRLQSAELHVSKLILGDAAPLRVSMGGTSRPRRKLYVQFAAVCLAILAIGATDRLAATIEIDRLHQLYDESRKNYALQREIEAEIAKLQNALSGGQSFVGGQKTDLLSTLATQLPQSDWITEVTFRNGSITLKGYCAKADQFARSLEPLADKQEITLLGEVTYDSASDRQRIAISYRPVAKR